MEITKTLASERKMREGALISKMPVPVLYESFSIPQYPRNLDSQLGLVDSTPVNLATIGLSDDATKCRIGIVGDVHQNSVVLEALLDHFAEESVSILFCLGDYSYTREPDRKGIRALQLNKSLELIHRWIMGDNERQAFVLMGNHEIEEWYYGSDSDGRASQAEIVNVVSRWKNAGRMRFTQSPLSSYEIENAFDITIYYGGNRRSFRLAHAVTKEFVSALYLGIEATGLVEARERIVSDFGQTWLETQLPISDIVRDRWNRFLSSDWGTAERFGVVQEICAHLRSQLTAESFLRSIPSTAGNVYGNARAYLALLTGVHSGREIDLDEFRLFWGPPRFIETETTSLNFAYDLRRFYSALGLGRMYSICGHFHADLGMFHASPEFGTHMIAVGGLQPRKIIGDSFSAYILECGGEMDRLYRLQVLDDPAVGEFDWDLTHPQWKDR